MIYVIHLEETDGDYVVKGFNNNKKVKEYILDKKLSSVDYTLIEGQLVPNFNPKDLKL